ncbi:hypothetical protein AVEN_148111-1 [Araneus ventricosus]|uniref:Helitron helicase-like domain-containing protein n=1 Tax=Araneus ventricosus TaxID=182803 RepID=A0A4Y2WXP6_ARAVE|nr:hypothetical protein AVEN_148111-1 [Araneus ventricosus]
MQQYDVDSYVKVEGNRLNFIRHIQRKLRVQLHLRLADHINALVTEVGIKSGVTLILLSSFIGSPREMQQNFQDAMSIFRDIGKPDLFLSFTCISKWNEIKDNFSWTKPHDRPNLVARVFDIKKKALIQDLKNMAFWIIYPCLTKKYNAHINVEICSSFISKNYVCKYVYKGHDCAKVVFDDIVQGPIIWDEIKTFLDARCLSAPKAMCRLLEKNAQ